jgi:hypothetical protein
VVQATEESDLFFEFTDGTVVRTSLNAPEIIEMIPSSKAELEIDVAENSRL